MELHPLRHHKLHRQLLQRHRLPVRYLLAKVAVCSLLAISLIYINPVLASAQNANANVSVSVVAPPTKNDFDYSTVNVTYVTDDGEKDIDSNDSAIPAVNNIWIRVKNKIISFFKSTGTSLMARL